MRGLNAREKGEKEEEMSRTRYAKEVGVAKKEEEVCLTP